MEAGVSHDMRNDDRINQGAVGNGRHMACVNQVVIHVGNHTGKALGDLKGEIGALPARHEAGGGRELAVAFQTQGLVGGGKVVQGHLLHTACEHLLNLLG